MEKIKTKDFDPTTLNPVPIIILGYFLLAILSHPSPHPHRVALETEKLTFKF